MLNFGKFKGSATETENQQVVVNDFDTFKAITESLTVNIALCDPETAIISYANQASLDTIKELEHLLPIRSDQLIGSNIDIFHKNPSHQRNIIADPKNLPHHAAIQLGDEHLDLYVVAIMDDKNNYIHTMLSWSKITDKVEHEGRASRLQQMVDKMPINAMMCDPRTLEMTYMNEASRNQLRSLEQYLPIKVSEMIGTSIDVFHKNPAHQREILGNPARLPWSAKINVGPETLELNVNAIVADDGTYLGPLATWSVITTQVQVEAAVNESVETLETEIASMQQQSQNLSSSAEQNIGLAAAVAAASEEATTNVQTVASATEELAASITEIGHQVKNATDISEAATSKANQANEQVQDLASAAQKIGDVVSLINDIAEQTNLLALNATIEAARAGEAGRGFAVVASEVKSLATQTAKATQDITVQIQSIQAETAKVVDVIGEISEAITNVNEISAGISSSTEEQAVATNEIARNVQEAAAGTQEVSANINDVRSASEAVSTVATDVAGSAERLDALSKTLTDEIAKL